MIYINTFFTSPYFKLVISTLSKCFFLFYFFYMKITHHINKFTLQLVYFISISTFGFLILNSLNPRSEINPRKIDLFFTSISAATVSSMSTVEMEVFSNNQLIVIIFLMTFGGEIFISMVGLFIRSLKIRNTNYPAAQNRVSSISSYSSSDDDNDQEIELNNIIIGLPNINNTRVHHQMSSLDSSHHLMLADSIKFLGFLVLVYLLIFHVLGVTSILLVTNLVTSTKNVLKEKGINQITFAIFTIVSTFTNCGFLPTNENMIVFNKNSGFLLLLIPQVIFGNVLFPPLLRGCLWFFAKFFKKLEAQYLLRNTKEIGYYHLVPEIYSWFLVSTVIGFVLLQFILFCALEWNSASLSELNTFQKIVGVLFQCVNSRHTGESIVDLSTIAPAMLVMFVVMMYLPPYTTFLPVSVESKIQQNSDQRRKSMAMPKLVDNMLFSPLSYLAVFIILICITERKSLKDDPLNFTILSITLEVISAYGSVGFSLGYSCDRQLKADPTCVNKWYGFAGKWTDSGKLILIVVMLFGRLKKHSMDGGKAWKLM